MQYMTDEHNGYAGVFSGNALKLAACVFMLIDHMGAILFPQIAALRAVGFTHIAVPDRGKRHFVEI